MRLTSMRMRTLQASTVVFGLAIAQPVPAFAQADEIQVYDAGLAAPGTFNLTLHNNYTFVGSTTPEYVGGGVANHALNGVVEWAYGATEWWEVGVYLPLYTFDHDGGHIDGMKLRTLFAVPHASDRRLFYGVGFELSANAKRWDSSRVTSEVRPIIGYRVGPVDLVVNPIFDTAYDGIGSLVFSPSLRVAYNPCPTISVAVEEYADFGPLDNPSPLREQSHQLFGVVDYANKYVEVELGVGAGLTAASDDLVMKLILARDLD